MISDEILYKIWRSNRAGETAEAVALRFDLPYTTVNRVIEVANALDVLRRAAQSHREVSRYPEKFPADVVDLLARFDAAVRRYVDNDVIFDDDAAALWGPFWRPTSADAAA